MLTNCCCKKCADGSVVNRLVNITTVRPPGDTSSGAPHYVDAPFQRGDVSNPSVYCTYPTVPYGTCGPWLTAGDYSGIPSQETSASSSSGWFNDINTSCSGGGLIRVDNNCYQPSTGTVLLSIGGWEPRLEAAG